MWRRFQLFLPAPSQNQLVILPPDNFQAMKTSIKIVLSVIIAVLAVLVAVYILQGVIGDETVDSAGSSQTETVAAQAEPHPPATEEEPQEAAEEEPAQTETLQRARPAQPQFQIMSPIHQSLAEIESLLQDEPTARQAHEALQQLRERLLSEDPELTSQAIQDFLASGRNASTGLPFSVGEGGDLRYANTLRTFLMDVLGQVDPQAAASVAETVFQQMTSPEEYALGLRAVARAESHGEDTPDYVGQRARQALTHEPWVNEPTAGLAEAFDAVVYAGDLQAIPILAQHAAPESSRELNHPAFMAMDRLVIQQPEATLETLLKQPQILDERPLTRASFFARADPGDPQQVALAEQYLASDISQREAQHFIGLFPNLNLMLSNNLLTDSPSITGQEVQDRLQGALQTIQSWQKDPRFQAYQDELARAQTRLSEQVAQK